MKFKINYFYFVPVTIGLLIPLLTYSLSVFQLYFLAVLILILLTLAFKINVIDFVNPGSVYFLYYLVLVAFGGIFANKYSDRIPVSEDVFFLVILGGFSFLMGVIVGRGIWPTSSVVSYYTFYTTWSFQAARFYSSLSIIIGIVLSLAYYSMAGTIPIFAENADYFRVEVKEGKSWLYLMSYGFFLVGLIIFTSNDIYNKKPYVRSLLIAILGLFLYIGLGYRAPAIQLILVWFLIYSYIKFGRIKIKDITILGIIILFAVGFTGWIRSNGDTSTNLSNIWMVLEWRFFVQISNIELIVDYINFNDFLFGKSLYLDLVTLLPGYQPSFAIWIKEMMGMEFAGGFTTTLIGEMYSNFGVWGVICFSVLIGVFSSFIFSKLLNNRNRLSLYSLGLLILTSLTIGAMVSSGLFTSIKNIFIPFGLLYIVLIKLFIREKNQNK